MASRSPQIETQHHQDNAGSQCSPDEVEQGDLTVVPRTKTAEGYPHDPYKRHYERNARDACQQYRGYNTGTGLKRRYLCGTHRRSSLTVVTPQWRTDPRLVARRIDMILNAGTYFFEIFP